MQKAVNVILDTSKGFPWISFKDKVSASKGVSVTKKYDAIAFKYLTYAMTPVLLIYAVYSLVYQEHKGWYSYVIGTLVGFVYAFGFIGMCPQLYINYKLKVFLGNRL